MEKKDTLSSCSDSEIQQMQLIQDKSKESCMVSFQRLHSHLKCLLNNDLKGSRTEDGFKRAFATLFGQDLETFTGTMFLYMDQLQKQLDNEEFQENGSMSAFKVLETQFQMFIKSRFYLDDEYVDMTRNKFLQYTRLDIPEFRDTLIQNMDPVKKFKRAETWIHASRSGNDAHVDDADIRPIYNEEPMAEISITNVKRTSSYCQCRVYIKYWYIVQSYRGRTQSLVAKKKDISENRASRNFDLMISNDAPFLNVQMMSDHNSSDLAPQRQEMSVENVSSGLQRRGGQDSSQQGLEFLFSPLLEEYYNPTHGQAEENNNDQAPNASFQEDEFINPFCTRIQEIGNKFVEITTHALGSIRTTVAHTDPEMCMFALTVSIVEPKNIKEAMADSTWIKAMQDELHQFDRLKVWELVDKPFGK
ncbi:hypothetical protein Tco_0752808 [Tanacetum coccineum]|uniref:Uncharacterized protein n=1 Tax=Tanacetum coccineum TaxID=301880 RepID=A0ABQ4Z8U4_9ASTR